MPKQLKKTAPPPHPLRPRSGREAHTITWCLYCQERHSPIGWEPDGGVVAHFNEHKTENQKNKRKGQGAIQLFAVRPFRSAVSLILQCIGRSSLLSPEMSSAPPKTLYIDPGRPPTAPGHLSKCIAAPVQQDACKGYIYTSPPFLLPLVFNRHFTTPWPLDHPWLPALQLQ
mgnify:CR=1 FL=1